MFTVMEEIISRAETFYKQRRIAPVIKEIGDSIPVVVISGARQVGKSIIGYDSHLPKAVISMSKSLL